MSKFHKDDRVIFRSRLGKDVFHCASVGYWGTVMHLNRTDGAGQVLPITGTIVKQSLSDGAGREYYIFQPDGWPADAKNRGFEADADCLEALQDQELRLPGTLTNEMGLPL